MTIDMIMKLKEFQAFSYEGVIKRVDIYIYINVWHSSEITYTWYTDQCQKLIFIQIDKAYVNSNPSRANIVVAGMNDNGSLRVTYWRDNATRIAELGKYQTFTDKLHSYENINKKV